MIISEKSFLYKVALFGETADSELQGVRTSCDFFGKVFKGLAYMLLVIAIGSFVTIAALEPIVSTVLWLFTDNPFQGFFDSNGGLLFVEAGVTFVLLFLYVCSLIGKLFDKLIRKWKEYKYEQTVRDDEDFVSTFELISTTLKGWKKKFCPTVKFRHPDKEYIFHIAYYTGDMDIGGIAKVTEDHYDQIHQHFRYRTSKVERNNKIEYTKFVTHGTFRKAMLERDI